MDILRAFQSFVPATWLSFERELATASQHVVAELSLQPWFKKTPRTRDYHRYVTHWISRHIRHDSVILETGCGIGQSFVVLSRAGYSRFIGVEKDAPTLEGCHRLCRQFGISPQLHEGDGTRVEEIVSPSSADVYLPLNWSYFAPEITPIINAAPKILKPGGTLILDIVRDDFKTADVKERATYDRYPYKRDVDHVIAEIRSNGMKLIESEKRFGARSVLIARLDKTV